MTGDFTPATRRTILDRDGAACIVCGAVYGLQLHHRRPRGMGGNRTAVTRSAANGITLCLTCHSTAESFRDVALKAGVLVPQHRDPREVPVKHRLHGWVTLTDQGTCDLYREDDKR